VLLNDRAKRLVEEIETEPSELPELEEETTSIAATITKEDDQTEADVVAKMPLCILEYMKEVEKQKLAKSLSSANETLEVENGMKNLPEELHFPINQRVEIWEDMVHKNCSDGEEVDLVD
jgi:chromatin segregation and condensation protein Rec8/ScpA/Scc1 (kleisin family)